MGVEPSDSLPIRSAHARAARIATRRWQPPCATGTFRGLAVARRGPTSRPRPESPMSIQNDRWITQMAKEHGMIEPFEERQVRQGVISYGVSSYGYDMRVAREYRIFTNVLNSIVDPKAFDPRSFVEFEGDVCIVP